jgi:hypothetical protein
VNGGEEKGSVGEGGGSRRGKDGGWEEEESAAVCAVRVASVRRGRLVVVCEDGWCFDLDLALVGF